MYAEKLSDAGGVELAWVKEVMQDGLELLEPLASTSPGL